MKELKLTAYEKMEFNHLKNECNSLFKAMKTVRQSKDEYINLYERFFAPKIVTGNQLLFIQAWNGNLKV